MVKRIRSIIQVKRTFQWQASADNCGLACLASIMAYSGLQLTANQSSWLLSKGKEVSLLDLRNAAVENGLICKCVQIDIEFLQTIRVPCILHTVTKKGNGHFVVSYGIRDKSGRLLIGDPGGGLMFLERDELGESWQSRAALFFEGLPKSTAKQSMPRLIQLAGGVLPLALWITLPSLTLAIIATSGLASLALQQIFEYGYLTSKPTLIAVFALLITSFLLRSVLSLIRQRISITANAMLSRQLMNMMIKDIGQVRAETPFSNNAQSILSDVQRLRTAIMGLISVLSDLFVILAIQLGMSYIFPYGGLIMITYLLGSLIHISVWLPEISFYQAALDQHLTAFPKDFAIAGWKRSACNEAFERYLKTVSHVASRSSSLNFYHEGAGVLLLLIMATCVMHTMAIQRISYGHFIFVLILTFYLSVVMQRVFMTAFTIMDGEDVCRRLNQRI